MIFSYIKELKKIIYSNKIILGYLDLPSESSGSTLHFYRAGLASKKNRNIIDQNLGDFLSFVVVNYLCNKFHKNLVGVEKKIHLYAIGSILLMGYQNATIWGTGFPFEPTLLRGLPHRDPFRKLDIRCVRGPKTRATLLRLGHKCPEFFGDPGVLMPLIYKPENIEKKFDYIVIPHYSSETYVDKRHSARIVSMFTTDYYSVIDKIVSSKLVISSSLHGIILAEAYGVPAAYYQDRPTKFNYKYEDWYLSTGRICKPLSSVDEAIEYSRYNQQEVLNFKNM